MEYRGAVVSVTLTICLTEEEIQDCMKEVGCDRDTAIEIVQAGIPFDQWDVDDANTEDMIYYD